jgi:hypothetical protein
VELIETSVFTTQIVALFSEEEYREFQSRIAINPELGALIRGRGGYARSASQLDRVEKAAEPESYISGPLGKT